jgi:hypothetical protein
MYVKGSRPISSAHSNQNINPHSNFPSYSTHFGGKTPAKPKVGGK